jgi:hypothetical protein
MGALANIPVAMVAAAVTMQVTAIKASLSIPVAALRIRGLTNMIYAMVRNVVSPATASIRGLVFLSVS